MHHHSIFRLMIVVVCGQFHLTGYQGGDGPGIGGITLYIELGTQYLDLLPVGMHDKRAPFIPGNREKGFPI